MKTFNNKIALNLDRDAQVSVKGFIAPIEYSSYNFHVEWDTLANFRVAEPEKQYPVVVFNFLRLSSYGSHLCRYVLGDCARGCAGTAEATSSESISEYAWGTTVL